MILKPTIAQNLIYVVFGITASVYFTELLEKWPQIGRFSTIVLNKNSTKIMLISWSSIIGILFFSLLSMKYCFVYIDNSNNNVLSVFLYALFLLSFMLVPKFGAGFIRGVNILFCRTEFIKKLKKAYIEGKTIEELYLSKMYIESHGILQNSGDEVKIDFNKIKVYATKKTIGNLSLLIVSLLIPIINYKSILLGVVLILFILAIFMPRF